MRDRREPEGPITTLLGGVVAVAAAVLANQRVLPRVELLRACIARILSQDARFCIFRRFTVTITVNSDVGPEVVVIGVAVDRLDLGRGPPSGGPAESGRPM